MEIIPAIDLREGKCVRLIQGQYHKQITYEDDPAKQAKIFAQAGANWLHVVDLEGALVGKPVNTETIKAIIASCEMNVEVGGGIRDEDAIKRMLDIGVQRVIIGTRAVSDFNWFAKTAVGYPNKLVLGLDARGSKVAVKGWTQDSPQQLFDFVTDAADLPIAAIIYTDISKDGMLSGPNIERTRQLAGITDIPVIASGGVSTVEDIKQLTKVGVNGAIIGRALYEGTLKLTDAINAAISPQD